MVVVMENWSVCIFELAELEQHLIGATKDCRNQGSGDSDVYTHVPWSSAGTIRCKPELDQEKARRKLGLQICGLEYYLEKKKEVGATDASETWPLPRIVKPLKAHRVLSRNGFGPNFAKVSAIDFKMINSDVLLFIATEEADESGNVFKALIKGTEGELIADGKSAISKTPITHLQVTDTSPNYIVVAGSEIFQRPLDSCKSYSNCTMCLSAGADPLCGWCLHSSNCLTEAECKKGLVSYVDLNIEKLFI